MVSLNSQAFTNFGCYIKKKIEVYIFKINFLNSNSSLIKEKNHFSSNSFLITHFHNILISYWLTILFFNHLFLKNTYHRITSQEIKIKQGLRQLSFIFKRINDVEYM